MHWFYSVMVWAAMTGAFRKKKNQLTMPLWHSPLQVLPVLTMRKSQFDVISYKTGLESVEARLLVYQQNETVFEKDIKLVKLDVQLRDNVLVVLKQKFKKAEQERDELKLKLENFKTDESLPASPKYDRYHSGDGYHVVPPPYTRTFMLTKPNLVFHDAPNVNETVHTAFNVELSPTKPDKELSHRPSAPIIEDWVFDSEDDSKAELPQNAPKNGSNTCYEPCTKGKSLAICQNDTSKSQRHVVPIAVLTKSKLVPLTAARQVTTAVSPNNVTRPRSAKTVITKPYSPPRRNINHTPSPKASNFSPKVTAAKAPMVNAIKGNWVWKPKCPILDHVSRHSNASMTLKRFDYNDALRRSKSVMAWVPKRH
nr:hypothetical protein [Tanacetum cinerariifolium]